MEGIENSLPIAVKYLALNVNVTITCLDAIDIFGNLKKSTCTLNMSKTKRNTSLILFIYIYI